MAVAGDSMPSFGMGGGMPHFENGERPGFGNGEIPEGMERPDFENKEMPKFGNGKRPDFENGEMPEGMERPDFGNGEKQDETSSKELSKEFVITSQGNYFYNTSVVE